MTEMPISKARDQISEIVGRARYAGEPTILTHHGQEVAVVISIDEYRSMREERETYWRKVEAALEANPQLRAELTKQINLAELTPWEEIR